MEMYSDSYSYSDSERQEVERQEGEKEHDMQVMSQTQATLQKPCPASNTWGAPQSADQASVDACSRQPHPQAASALAAKTPAAS